MVIGTFSCFRTNNSLSRRTGLALSASSTPDVAAITMGATRSVLRAQWGRQIYFPRYVRLKV